MRTDAAAANHELLCYLMSSSQKRV
jgi:hypothetical protein